MLNKNRLILLCIFTMLPLSLCAKLDHQKPDGISDKKWTSLKSSIQTAKLIPTPVGVGGQDGYFGESVSIDGNRALIGAPGTTASGAVYVFDFNGSSWEKTALLIPSDGEYNDNFGYSVSLFGDRALIGANQDNNSNFRSGSAYIFEYDGSNWIQSQKITASDAAFNDQFGSSVSLSSRWAVIGAINKSDNGNDDGSAYVFEYENNIWFEVQKLTTDDAGGAFLGGSIDILGNRMVVGAYDDSPGSAYVFDFNGISWSQSQKLIPNDGSSGDDFGYAVSLSIDRVLIGSYRDDDLGLNSGSAYVFDYDGSNWNQSQKLIPDDGNIGDGFGYAVNLLDNRILVGANYGEDGSNAQGTSYVFDFDGSNWSQSQKLSSGDGANNERFGNAISMSNDHVLVGAYLDDEFGDSSGSTYVFGFDGNSWSQIQKLNPDEGSTGDNFGLSVSLSGDRALIGSFGDEDFSDSSGSAYIFDFDGFNWSLTQKLYPHNGSASDSFGYSVSLYGERALIGAHDDDELGTETGSAYIFEFDGTNWSQTQKLKADDAQSFDYFGWSVSLLADRALIGAYGDDDIANGSGSAYLFDFNGINWSQTQKLKATDAQSFDNFGDSISLSSDRALIGAYRDDDLGSESGSAYVFDFDGNSWFQTQKLTSNDGGGNDNFGRSVSLSGDWALIGAYNVGLGNVIAAYMFNYDGSSWNQQQKLTSDVSGDFFGWSVSLSNNKALIGATRSDSELGNNLGAAYVFDFDGNNWNQVQKLTADDGASLDDFGRSVSLSGDRKLIGASGVLEDTGAAYIFNLDLIFENNFEEGD